MSIEGSMRRLWSCCRSVACGKCYKKYIKQQASGAQPNEVKCNFCSKSSASLTECPYIYKGPSWINRELEDRIIFFTSLVQNQKCRYLFAFMKNRLYCNFSWEHIATIASDPSNPVNLVLWRRYNDFVQSNISSMLLFYVMRIPDINLSFSICFQRKETMMAFWEILKCSSSTPLTFKRIKKMHFGMMIAFLKRCIPRLLRFWRSLTIKHLLANI